MVSSHLARCSLFYSLQSLGHVVKLHCNVSESVVSCTLVNRGTSLDLETGQMNNGYQKEQNKVLNESTQSPVILGIAKRQDCQALPQVIVDIVLPRKHFRHLARFLHSVFHSIFCSVRIPFRVLGTFLTHMIFLLVRSKFEDVSDLSSLHIYK